MGPRAGLSSVLVAGALVLVIAIAIGNSMGNRVLGQIGGRAPTFATTPLPSATPSGGEDPGRQVLWKRRQVLSVATDPAFPDPRITPEPPPEHTAPPRRSTVAVPKAAPSPSPTPSETPEPPRNSTYTSPPLLIPMKSHAHDESPSPEPSGAPAGPPAESPAARTPVAHAASPGAQPTGPTAP